MGFSVKFRLGLARLGRNVLYETSHRVCPSSIVVRSGLMQRNLTNKTTEPPSEDPRGTLVYRSSNRNIVFYAKAFSLFSSSVILSFQPFIVLKLSNSGLTVVAVACGLGFSVLTPLLLHLITRSHVHKLYYNDTTKIFTAYTRGLFLTQKRLSFTAAEVSYCEPGFSMANLAVRGTPLFISETDFPDLVLYKHLMGFDRPMKFN